MSCYVLGDETRGKDRVEDMRRDGEERSENKHTHTHTHGALHLSLKTVKL